MPVSAYRGYRGPRRKFRPQQPRLLSRSSSLAPFLHLTLTLPPPPSPLRLPPLLLRGPTNSGRVGISRPRGDPQLPPGTCYEGSLYEGRARRQPYIPTVHTGRIPDVDTYNRRKVPTSTSTTEHSRWPSRTVVLNHPSRGGVPLRGNAAYTCARAKVPSARYSPGNGTSESGGTRARKGKNYVRALGALDVFTID